ncbi:MAG: TolC family protein [Sphingobacteriaceae bacterium]|nr:TolC family protein [Sphingobacteriaceae bacterium]
MQSSKSFLELSEKNYQRSQIETKATITKAYYTALVSKERLKLLQANVDRLKKLVEDTKSLNTNGFVEKIDVTRVTVAYNNLLSEKEKIERLVGLTESVLKFQMGMEIKSQINLTDSLHLDNIPVFDISTSSELNYKNRIEYSLLESQQRLNELDVKRGKLRYLPSIFLYGNYSAQAQRNEFDFFDTNKKWYPIGIIGGTINLPLFDGFQNHNRLQQSKINLMKTINNMDNLKNAIDLEIETSKSSLLNALSTLNIQKTNIELAKEVYDVAKKKYEQGSGSSIEVMNAETALKEAQTNYYNGLYEYFTAKVDYEKATGVIK